MILAILGLEQTEAKSREIHGVEPEVQCPLPAPNLRVRAETSPAILLL